MGESTSILQVTCAVSKQAMKLKVHMIKSFIYVRTPQKYDSFVPLGIVTVIMLRTHNTTDSNKLVTFSGTALYYGDTYIVLHLLHLHTLDLDRQVGYKFHVAAGGGINSIIF